MAPPSENSSAPYPSDEIDLFELFASLWKQKWLIGLVTLTATLLGVVYVFLATPQYVATVSLKPLTASEVKPLKDLTLFTELSDGNLLRDYVATLYSSDFLLEFAQEAGDPASATLYEAADKAGKLKAVQDKLTIKAADTQQETALFPYQLEFSAPSANVAADELNRLIEKTSETLARTLEHRYESAVSSETARLKSRLARLKSELAIKRDNEIKRLQEEHKLKLAQLHDQLAARKTTYNSALQDQIKTLEEAYAIAKSLNLEAPMALNRMGRATSSRVEILAEMQSQEDLPYLRGTRLLKAELEQLKTRSPNFYPDEQVRALEAQIASVENNRRVEILKARKNDTPFSDEISQIHARLATLENEEFPKQLRLDFSNAPAIAPRDPTKPKKMLIVALSAVLGGMGGILIALVRGAISNRRSLGP